MIKSAGLVAGRSKLKSPLIPWWQTAGTGFPAICSQSAPSVFLFAAKLQMHLSPRLLLYLIHVVADGGEWELYNNASVCTQSRGNGGEASG